MKLPDIYRCYLMCKLPLKDLQEFIRNGSHDDLRRCFETTLGQVTHSPPIQFRRKWATFIIKQLDIRRMATQQPQSNEEDEYSDLDEIIDEWYNALRHMSTLDPQTEPFYRYYNVNGDFIKMYESEDAFVCNGTTGLITWEASIQLSKYFLTDLRSSEAFRWIIELGSGCGYLPIAIVKGQEETRSSSVLQKYIATDGSPDALSQCRKNIEANFGEGTECPIVLKPIDWVNLEDTKEFIASVEEATREHGAGCLIGADVIFDPALIPSLVHLFNAFLTIQASNSYPGKAILSCETRNERTMESLKSQLDACGRQLEQTAQWDNGRIYIIA